MLVLGNRCQLAEVVDVEQRLLCKHSDANHLRNIGHASLVEHNDIIRFIFKKLVGIYLRDGGCDDARFTYAFTLLLANACAERLRLALNCAIFAATPSTGILLCDTTRTVFL